MSQHESSRRGRLWFRRILSVIAGFVAVVVLSVLTDMLLEMAGVFPPPDQGLYDTGLLLIATGYRSLYTLAGGYLTARLAPDRPLPHAVALGIVGLVAGSLGAVANAGLGPAWYAWGLVVLAMPLTWLGGKLVALRAGVRTTSEA